ncbi:GNAT family N-acetyltransferase [Blastopirellula sp. JC733]|nr:GNAT family N-acetyltransferase [Blastopirellula sediminis]
MMQRALLRPSENEFHIEQERPGYDPGQRIVCKADGQIVGHVRVIRRKTRFADRIATTLHVDELATAPEFRGRGIAAQLLAEVDAELQRCGAECAVYRTEAPDYLARRGWTALSSQTRSHGDPAQILANMQRPLPLRNWEEETNEPTRLSIRLYRQVEFAGLTSLYERRWGDLLGAAVRTQEQWRWLLDRRGFQQLYVAIDGGNKLSLDDDSRIVGYAMTGGGQILEVVAAPGREDVSAELLRRICGDAMERDQRIVYYHAPAADPLHRAVRSAAPPQRPVSNSTVMVRWRHPLQSLAEHAERFRTNLAKVGYPLPCDLGLHVEGEKHSLHFNERSGSLSDGKLGRSFIRLSQNDLVRLLCGDLNVAQALDRGELFASTKMATDAAIAALKMPPLWFPPLEDASAI